MTTVTRNPWFRAGDANAFFALMFDNVANLVILTAILVGAFGFPRDLVLHRIVPQLLSCSVAGSAYFRN